MKAIGGYPELELKKGEHYHKDALKLNTARNCLEYILYTRNYRTVYIPYYTCEAVLEPFLKLGTEYRFYHINKDFEPLNLPDLKEGEAFLYTNYFGLKDNCVKQLANHYGQCLIVDNAQAFFDMPIIGIDTFYSARKFFGVPDGAYLYTDKTTEEYLGCEIEQATSYERMTALLKRIDLSAEQGFKNFKAIEEQLSGQNIKKMSKLTDAILRSIDYDSVRNRRRENYKALYWDLFKKNKETTLQIEDNAVPLAYPFQTESQSLRQYLINNKIYVPMYWPNVIKGCDPDSLEYKLGKEIIPLPVDQRYGENDMKRIIRIINN